MATNKARLPDSPAHGAAALLGGLCATVPLSAPGVGQLQQRPLPMPIHPDWHYVIALPDVNKRLKELQVDPGGNTSEEFKRIVAAELPRWAAIAKAANIKLD